LLVRQRDLPSLCQPDSRKATQSDFTPLAVNNNALNPKASTVIINAKEKPGSAAIVILAGLGGFHLRGSQPAALHVGRHFPHFYVPQFFPHKPTDDTVAQRTKANK
jgi:hypothetical protein